MVWHCARVTPWQQLSSQGGVNQDCSSIIAHCFADCLESKNRAENIATAEKLVHQTVSKGAQIVLLQELFETLYFCQI